VRGGDLLTLPAESFIVTAKPIRGTGPRETFPKTGEKEKASPSVLMHKSAAGGESGKEQEEGKYRCAMRCKGPR